MGCENSLAAHLSLVPYWCPKKECVMAKNDCQICVCKAVHVEEVGIRSQNASHEIVIDIVCERCIFLSIGVKFC